MTQDMHIHDKDRKSELKFMDIDFSELEKLANLEPLNSGVYSVQKGNLPKNGGVITLCGTCQ